MDFEDIVDMDWLNSHTVDTSLPSPPTIKEEPMDMQLFPNANMDITLDYPKLLDYPKDMLVMPSTEQIKQLIDLAKKQLVLREQLASCQLMPEPTPEPESPISINPNTITTDIKIEENDKITSEKSQSKKRGSIPPEMEGPISLEAYAASDGIDIKSLTSKERRQLRNKISARNFRVRRKEYITSLEGQVSQHKKENEQLLGKLQLIEEENKKLKVELESLKCQNLQLSKNNMQLLGSSDSPSIDTPILVS